MSHVVTTVCLGCKCGRCADVCPMDAFREGEQMLFIDPDVCDDCRACVDECDRGAIIAEADLPEQWRIMAEINRQRARLLPTITGSRPPLGFPLWAANGASL